MPLNNKKITVIIPTYNKFDCIKFLLENSIAKYCGNLFLFEIHDSSDDSRVAEIVELYLKNYPLCYYNYSAEMNGDVKTMTAIRNAQSEYVYLMGDGLVPDFNELEKFLIDYDYEKYLVIGIRSAYDFKRSVKKAILGKSELDKPAVYDDKAKFCKQCFWALTLYGASIVKKSLLFNNNNYLQYLEMKSPFMYVCSLFESLLQVDNERYIFSFVNFINNNPYKIDSGWMQSRQAIEFFCYKYYTSVSNLSQYSSLLHKDFLMSHNKFSGLFSIKSIIKMRATGNLTASIIKEYKDYYKKTVPYGKRVLVRCSLFMPQKALNKLYKKYKSNKLKRLNEQ